MVMCVDVIKYYQKFPWYLQSVMAFDGSDVKALRESLKARFSVFPVSEIRVNSLTKKSFAFWKAILRNTCDNRQISRGWYYVRSFA